MKASEKTRQRIAYLLNQKFSTDESARAMRQFSHPLAYDEDIGTVHAAELLHRNGTLAGDTVPVVSGVKDESPAVQMHDLRTDAERHEFLSGLAREENVVAIARALVAVKMGKHVAEVQRLESEGKDLDAAVQASQFDAVIAHYGDNPRDAYAAFVDAEMDAARKIADALPDDLPTLKTVLCERTEAAATGRQKHLKGAITQQAIDNWAQCEGIDTALQEVSKQCAIACIVIQRAADAAAAKAAYDAGVKAIEAVTAIHTPVWVVDGVDYTAAQAAPVALAGSAATVTAKHPAGQDIDGPVVLTSVASAPVSVAAVQTTDAKAHSCKFTVKTPVAGETVKLFLTARSLCGPSELEVHLTP